MILSKYISGTIFIDDKIDEVKKLSQYFERHNIWSKFINPNEFDGKLDCNYAGTRLVFLDLQYALAEKVEIARAVNILRQLSENEIKNVILVVWSMHSDEIEELIRLINDKMNDDKPIIILDAKKEDCLDMDDEGFDNMMNKLFEDSISENQLIYSILEWEKNTVFASRNTVNDIIGLSYDDLSKEFDLGTVLLEMAKVSSDDTNIKSVFPYMHDILSDNIIKYSDNIENHKLPEKSSTEELKLKLNTLQMIKKDDIEKCNPGDVYVLELSDEQKKELIDEVKENFSSIVELDKIIPIQLDITPQCTFSKSDKSIMLNGLIIENYTDQIIKHLKKGGKPTENFLIDYYYESIGNKKNILVLDFIKTNYINKKENKLKKIYCLKSQYRTSIQQRFGSFLTRIGDNVIHKVK